MRWRTVIVAGVAPLLVLGACGGDADEAVGGSGPGALSSTGSASEEPEPVPEEVLQSTQEESGLVLWAEEDFEEGPGIVGMDTNGRTVVTEGRLWISSPGGQGGIATANPLPSSDSVRVVVDIFPPDDLDADNSYAVYVFEDDTNWATSPHYSVNFYPPRPDDPVALVTLFRGDPSLDDTTDLLDFVELDALGPAHLDLLIESVEEGTRLSLRVGESSIQTVDRPGMKRFGTVMIDVDGPDLSVGFDNLEIWLDPAA